MEQFKAVNLPTIRELTFPLKIDKLLHNVESGAGDPNAILNRRSDLIRACYASLEAKQIIVEEFNSKFPDCSKKSIDRIFKEIIVKEKRDQDVRPVWYATAEILAELKMNTPEVEEELKSLADTRMEPLIREA